MLQTGAPLLHPPDRHLGFCGQGSSPSWYAPKPKAPELLVYWGGRPAREEEKAAARPGGSEGHPLVVIQAEAIIQSDGVIWLGCDSAEGQEGKLFNGRWTTQQASHSIQFKELYHIILSAIVWVHTWSTLKVHLSCDNQAIVHSIAAGTPHCPHIMQLLRNHSLIAATHTTLSVSIHWTGPLDWTTGLDYGTGLTFDLKTE